MKIDPRIQPSNESQSDAVKATQKGAVHSSTDAKPPTHANAPAGDTVQLSIQHSEIQRLNAQVASVPEVRAERIAPLQAKVQSGTYAPDSGKVADAILAEHSGTSVKA